MFSSTPDLSHPIESTQGPEYTPTGIPGALLTQVIDGIRADVAAVKGAMEQIYLRMVGGSILVVYEGDPDVLRLALSGEVDAGS